MHRITRQIILGLAIVVIALVLLIATNPVLQIMIFGDVLWTG